MAEAGRTDGAAGLDGTGDVGCDDEGGGSFSVTAPAITAGGLERAAAG